MPMLAVTVSSIGADVSRAQEIGRDQIYARFQKILRRDIAQKFRRNMLYEFKALTSTWFHYVPFRSRTRIDGDQLIAEVYTDDDIFRFVNDGTSVRYATMTEDFVAKTSPGSLRSGTGEGGLAYVNPRVPRDGIEARRFTETLMYKYDNEFYFEVFDRISKEISDMLRKSAGI